MTRSLLHQQRRGLRQPGEQCSSRNEENWTDLQCHLQLELTGLRTESSHGCGQRARRETEGVTLGARAGYWEGEPMRRALQFVWHGESVALFQSYSC